MAGFFEDAGVETTDAPDDPYGFGNEYHRIRIMELKDPAVTKSGDKFGIMITWAVDEPKYQGSPVSKNLGYGNWQQLPVPKALQGSVPWDKNSEEGQKVLFNLRKLYEALGFKADEMKSVGPAELLYKGCLAKIKVTQNADGFWQFNPYALKPMGSENGADEFAQPESGNKAKTADEILADELKNA